MKSLLSEAGNIAQDVLDRLVLAAGVGGYQYVVRDGKLAVQSQVPTMRVPDTQPPV
jgi:hypothetical protein